jgi:hypothetical protein
MLPSLPLISFTLLSFSSPLPLVPFFPLPSFTGVRWYNPRKIFCSYGCLIADEF